MAKQVTRREILGYGAALGAAFTGTVLAGCTSFPGKSAKKADADTAKPDQGLWTFRKIDPETAARMGYEGYYEGRCCYGAFMGIVGQMAREYGEPYRSFPFKMMEFGTTGVAGYGSLCGALNGAAAAIGLFYGGKDRDKMITELFIWYENTPLPVHTPQNPHVSAEISRTTAHSVLCHRSCGIWMKETGYKASSKERADRCARVAGDVARKTVEILNARLDGQQFAGKLSDTTGNCLSCHDKGKTVDNAKVKMECSPCHSDKLKNHPA